MIRRLGMIDNRARRRSVQKTLRIERLDIDRQAVNPCHTNHGARWKAEP
ncbi:MAG: hypothetical protein RIR86_114 [Acidobacteriota bacterium]